jgi:hemoglobin
MERQAAKQKAFLTMAFGGPNDYSGKDMRTAHARFVKMGLGDSQFNAVLEHLSATLVDLSVPPALIAQVMALAESTRADVLNK